MSAIPEKWKQRLTAGGTATVSEINPAWADYMEAFAKEMAEAVVGKAITYVEEEESSDSWYVCTFCGAQSSEPGKIDHYNDCKESRAQEYLKGKT